MINFERNGCDVSASLWDAHVKFPNHLPWNRFRSVKDCAELWSSFAKESKRIQSSPNFLNVHYEQLVDSPLIVVEEECKFLEIEVLRELPESSNLNDNIVTDKGPWKTRVHGAIKRASKFQSVLNEEELKIVNGIIGVSYKEPAMSH